MELAIWQPECSTCNRPHLKPSRPREAVIGLSSSDLRQLRAGRLLAEVLAAKAQAAVDLRCTHADADAHDLPNQRTFTCLHHGPDVLVITIDDPHGDNDVGSSGRPSRMKLPSSRIPGRLNLEAWLHPSRLPMDLEYELRAVVYHSGSNERGHYTVSTRTLLGGPSDWEYIDNDVIRPKDNHHQPRGEGFDPAMIMYVRAGSAARPRMTEQIRSAAVETAEVWDGSS